MATELGKAFVQIIPSAKGISGNIAKELEPEAGVAGDKAGRSLGRRMVGMLGKLAIGAAVAKTVTSALTQGGELEQNLGGTEAVFGDFAKNIQDSAVEAYRNMGLSASDYMATANVMGSLFQGSGVSQVRSLELTSDAMQRAADVASVMGIDTKFAMDSIAGAAKGNFTMMDNLGVAMNATTLQAYALEKGINFKWNTASNAEKAELAMKMFMDRTTQYAGNFARESEETFTGALGAMKSSWQNLLGDLATGQDIGGALQAFSSTLVTFLKNLIPMLTSIVSQLPMIVTNILLEAGPGLITSGAEMLIGIADGFASAIPNLIPAAVEAIQTIITGLLDALPKLVETGLSLVVALVRGLLEAIPQLVEAIPQIIDSLITTILDAIPLIIDAGVELLTALVDNLPLIIETIVQVLPEIITNIVEKLAGSIPQIIEAGVRLLTSLVENLPQIIITIVNALPQIIMGIIDALINNIPLIIDAGVQLFTAIITNLPTIIWQIVQAIPQIISAIVGGFGDLMWKIIGIGGDIARGIWQGIQNLAGWLWNKVKGWASSIWQGVKNFFGIRSPSRLFEDLGEQLPAGLAGGVLGNTKIVEKAMDELGNVATRSYAADLAFETTSSTALNPLSASIASGPATTKEELLDRPLEFTLVLGGHRWKAFVDRLTDQQSYTLELSETF